MKRKEKLRQIAKEAKSVLWAVIAIIVFWIVAGFGVSKLHITIFHTPLWAVTGCIGTWIFSIIVVVYLMKRVFKDFDQHNDHKNKHRHQCQNILIHLHFPPPDQSL